MDFGDRMMPRSSVISRKRKDVTVSELVPLTAGGPAGVDLGVDGQAETVGTFFILKWG